MMKVVNEENGLIQSKKAKKIILSLKASVMALIIAVTSMAGGQLAKAQGVDAEGDAFGFVDADGNFVPNASAPEAYVGEAESVIADEIDPGLIEGTLTFDEIKSLLLAYLDSAFVWQEYAVEEPDYHITFEQPEVVEETVIEPEVSDDQVIETEFVDNEEDLRFDQMPIVVDEPLESVEETVEEVEEDTQCLEEAIVDPSEVDQSYTGVAPKGYIGLNKTLVNYGDASNDEEVRERATIVYNHFHRMNESYGGLVLFNPYTYQEYTIEELMGIIKYMNGAYVAKDGADAQYINDLWIEFMVSILCDTNLIEDVNYKAGITPIAEDDVINHENVLENLDLTVLLMGDSATQPFMKWFAGQINRMFSTTSREEAIAIYNETYLAVTAVVEGNGYVINGVNYRIGDFSRVNDLLFVLEVMVSQEMRNDKMEIGYVFDKEFVGEDYVYLTDVLELFNPLCSEDIIAKLKSNSIEVTEGVIEYGDGTPIQMKDYGSVMQMNALGAAIANGEYGIEYYQSRYLNALNNGTYEGSLEPDYVYKKSN